MIKKLVLIIVSILLVLGIGVGIYIGDYYHADEIAMNCISEQSDEVRVTEKEGNYIFSSDNPIAGIVFYPGGKVEVESYAPLMKQLAEYNVMSILVTMPANLAVFGVDKAEGLIKDYPDVPKWYMAGHSLGGSMAANYLSEHAEKYAGLILLASYSTETLADKNLDVLSVYGDCDKVLNLESYKENVKNLPKDYTEKIIEGGCHAYFGSYGIQDGDGKPSITREEQLEQTVEAIVRFVK